MRKSNNGNKSKILYHHEDGLINNTTLVFKPVLEVSICRICLYKEPDKK